MNLRRSVRILALRVRIKRRLRLAGLQVWWDMNIPDFVAALEQMRRIVR
jgi:hypothetical protein